MFTPKDREKIAKSIEKAQHIEELVKHPGWADLMELINTLMEQERNALAGQKLDNSYYKKIGFLQMTKYFQALPTLIADEGVREYLLHQGRLMALELLQKLPQYSFDGRQFAEQQLRQADGGMTDQERKNFFEKQFS